VNIVPQNTSAAPSVPAGELQRLTWTPVAQSQTQTTDLAAVGQTLNVPGITGKVAAYSVPANIGELTITLTSLANKQTGIYAPNVLVLDQNASAGTAETVSAGLYHTAGSAENDNHDQPGEGLRQRGG